MHLWCIVSQNGPSLRTHGWAIPINKIRVVCVCVCVLDCRHCLLFCRSPDFSRLCTRVFDRGDKFNMNFDDFIQCCVMIRMLTDAFKKKDVQQRGLIQIHYEEVRNVMAYCKCGVNL